MRRPVLSTALLLLLLAGCTSAPGDDGGDGEGAGRWRPTPGTTWQWQLSGKLDTSVDVPVYDIDGFDHGKATVAGLHEDGRKVICYVSTGAWEDFRPDADEFPAEVLGKGNGWEGERWLDIRATDVLEPLMAERLDMCREKGFDAVEPDNMDGYKNETGFPLTGDDQLRYNRLIAKLAHDRGMAVGLNERPRPQIPNWWTRQPLRATPAVDTTPSRPARRGPPTPPCPGPPYATAARRRPRCPVRRTRLSRRVAMPPRLRAVVRRPRCGPSPCRVAAGSRAAGRGGSPDRAKPRVGEGGRSGTPLCRVTLPSRSAPTLGSLLRRAAPPRHTRAG
ncbi:hypothetical protein SVIOM342S_05603 [Streptomyces violaceorubidus]